MLFAVNRAEAKAPDVQTPTKERCAMGWNVNDLTSQTGAPTPVSNFAGYAFESQGTQHVMYTTADGHIHELWWDNSGWHHHDITAEAWYPQPAAADSVYLAGYALDNPGYQHVVYRGSDNNIYDLGWYPSVGWYTTQLTGGSGAPPAAAGSDPAAYVFNTEGTQHVVYRGADNQIYELWANFDVGYDAQRNFVGDCYYTALTKELGAPPAAPDALPVGFAFNEMNTQHVVYVADTSGDPNNPGWGPPGIFELWWDSTGWHYVNASREAGAPASGTGRLVAYAFETFIFATKHIFYTDANDVTLRELWGDSTWHFNDQRKPPGTSLNPHVFMYAPVAGYGFKVQSPQPTQHVFTLATDTVDLYELRWESRVWNANDLTTGLGLGQYMSRPTAYVFNAQPTQHVICTSTDTLEDPNPHIYELWSG